MFFMGIHSNTRFETLDAMRGVAAFLVLVSHLAKTGPAIGVSAQLAVDFFFVLSGFVIAQAYGQRFKEGLSFAGFVRERLIRLYPLFFFGLVLAIVKEFGDIAFRQQAALAPLTLLRAAGLESVMLPASIATRPDLFPLNAPAWSLFFEMAINLVFALTALHLTTRRLAVVIGVMAVGVVAASMSAGSLDTGWGWNNAWAGVARVGFSFPLGVLIQRLGLAQRRGASLWFLAPIAVLAAFIITPVPYSVRAAFDSGFVLLVSPILLVSGAALEPPRVMRGLCAKMGELSYPLYATHYPLVFVGALVAHKAGLPARVYAPILLVGLPIFALALSRSYDAPVRAWLNLRLAPRQRAVMARGA